MKTKITALCVMGVVLISAVFYAYPMLQSAVGLAARQACSLQFVSDLPLAFARRTYIDRHIRPIGSLVEIETDLVDRASKAKLLGLIEASASFVDGYGCVIDYRQDPVDLIPYKRTPILTVEVDEAARGLAFDGAMLDSALEKAFHEPVDPPVRQSMAIVVLHAGRLVAERYADGVSQRTPLPGFSMAKSMTATMVGLLVQHKGLDVTSAIANAGELTKAGVTYDQLLRMTSGVGIDEDGSGRDLNSVMLTQTHDAAAFAANQPLLSTPDAVYAYNGGGPVVLAKAFVEIAGGGDPSMAYRFLSEVLLEPVGLQSVVLETDGVGTFLGSSFMLASALDWARLGQLYLQDGRWNGQQILPPDWSQYVRTKTPQSGARDYGAGFWTAVTGGRDSQHAQLPQPPKDAYFMHGMMNQVVYIVPSRELVIARLGATRSYLHSGEWTLLQEVLGAAKE